MIGRFRGKEEKTIIVAENKSAPTLSRSNGATAVRLLHFIILGE